MVLQSTQCSISIFVYGDAFDDDAFDDDVAEWIIYIYILCSVLFV